MPALTKFHLTSLIAALAMLTGCTAPNHVGNPLLLPVGAITSAVENASYDRRRAKVKTWITTHETEMRSEGFDGPVTNALVDSLPKARRAQARAELIDAAQFPDFAERATVIVMVMSG